MTTLTDITQMPSRPSQEEAEQAVRVLLKWIGENPDREGLQKTPKRVIAAYKEHFEGYNCDISSILCSTFQEIEDYEDMVLLKDLPIVSHCEHHMAPIIGKAHVAYVPNKKFVGISKIARLVKAFSKRLQTQEILTTQIANAMYHTLDSKGSAVHIDAYHHCMTTRGVNHPQVSTVTNKYTGIFSESDFWKKQFYRNTGI